jgi:hypothetical protein
VLNRPYRPGPQTYPHISAASSPIDFQVLDASNGDLQQQVADLAYILDHAPGVTPAIADQVMNELNTVYTTGKLNHNGYDELYIKLTNGNSLELTSFPPDPGSQYVSDYPEVGDWQFRVDIYMP